MRDDSKEVVLGPRRLAQLLLGGLRLGVEAGVVQSDARPGGDAQCQPFVGLGEVGGVGMAEDQSADEPPLAGEDRDGQHALHVLPLALGMEELLDAHVVYWARVASAIRSAPRPAD